MIISFRCKKYVNNAQTLWHCFIMQSSVYGWIREDRGGLTETVPDVCGEIPQLELPGAAARWLSQSRAGAFRGTISANVSELLSDTQMRPVHEPYHAFTHLKIQKKTTILMKSIKSMFSVLFHPNLPDFFLAGSGDGNENETKQIKRGGEETHEEWRLITHTDVNTHM